MLRRCGDGSLGKSNKDLMAFSSGSKGLRVRNWPCLKTLWDKATKRVLYTSIVRLLQNPGQCPVYGVDVGCPRMRPRYVDLGVCSAHVSFDVHKNGMAVRSRCPLHNLQASPVKCVSHAGTL